MESFSHENTKRRKTEVTTKGGKVDRKMMRDMENLAIEDVTAEDWKMDDGSLEEALGTMNLDKAVKDIVWKKISKGQGSSTQGSASESSSSEDESDQKKKKQLLKKEKKTKANKKTKSSSSRSTRGLDDLEKTCHDQGPGLLQGPVLIRPQRAAVYRRCPEGLGKGFEEPGSGEEVAQDGRGQDGIDLEL